MLLWGKQFMGKGTVIRDEQQPLRILVKPAYGKQLLCVDPV